MNSPKIALFVLLSSCLFSTFTGYLSPMYSAAFHCTDPLVYNVHIVLGCNVLGSIKL